VIKFFNRIKKLSPLDGYDKWAATYHVEDNPIKKLSDEFIKSELPDLKGKSVLDAGCGTGRFCVIALEQGATSVKGMDLSPKMIEEAKKNCPRAEFECADLSKTDLIEKYDVIICGLVLGHIENVEPVLKNFVSALKPGGHVLLTDFHPYQTAMKAKRTFSFDHRTFEVAHTLHPLDEYIALLKKFSIETLSFKEPEYNSHPVIFGIHGVAA
jgi:malonyl-CoA O-methyltransferase